MFWQMLRKRAYISINPYGLLSDISMQIQFYWRVPLFVFSFPDFCVQGSKQTIVHNKQ